MSASTRFPEARGAIPFSGGVTFRVWAPFATSVHVAGDFNGGSSSATPLEREPSGYWSADVLGATPGQEYHFVLNGSSKRLDPYAKSLTNSVGTGFIYDSVFPWQNDFRTPPWNELVIY